MANIKQAIEYAKQNPNTPFATELRSRIESGKMDNELSSAGLPTSATVKKNSGIVAETKDDFKQIGTGILEDANKRANNFSKIDKAQAMGEQGKVRSLFQKFGQGAGLVSDVIGRGVTGLGKMVLPQKAEEFVGEKVGQGVQAVAETDPVQSILGKYNTLKETNPDLARDIDAALNISMLGLDVATAGVGGRATNLATKGITKTGELATKGAGKVGAGARRVGFELEGALTGTSQETLEQAFQSARKGGKELDQFTESLRGKITPEDLVQSVRSSVDEVSAKRSSNFKESFAPISGKIVDTSSVQNSVTKKLGEFGIKIGDDGMLDFNSSKFRQTPQAQTKLAQMWQEVSQLQGKKTLQEVDTTRQVLKELMLTGDDASARSANALITQATDSVREAGKKVNGYEEMLKNFAEESEFLNELQRSLSVGDKATVDTAYRKLATSLKTNNERRMSLIRELDEATDGAILGKISGQQLAEALPRGLFRQISAGLVGAGIATGGISTSIMPALVFASPRVAGEVVRALGLAASKTDAILEALNNARKVVDKLSVPVPLASPIAEVAEPVLQEAQE